MEDPILWYEAYANISSNDGAITKGGDNTTLDGFSKERVMSIIQRLKDGTYHFKPGRRTSMLKANGKKRPLGISSGDDKLVRGAWSDPCWNASMSLCSRTVLMAFDQVDLLLPHWNRLSTSGRPSNGW
jgi:hypothetical protein